MNIIKRQLTVDSDQWSLNKEKLTTHHSSLITGFTLMELLVVIAIIGMLAGILLPTLNKARERANRAVCVGNLKVIGEAFNMYNIDRGEMPPTDATNTATNQIRTATDIIGMGYFYNDPNANINTDDYIEDFAVFVCPASDIYSDPTVLKNRWNIPNTTFCAYIYRAESGNNVGLMLSDAKPAIVMDYNSDGTIGTANYNHKGEYVNILFKNGNVKGVENLDGTGAITKDGLLTLGAAGQTEDNIFENGADSYQ